MSEQERVRFEVAFDGGQILGGFATAASVEQLERTLAAGGEGVVTLVADDGEMTVARPGASSTSSASPARAASASAAA